jgi:hypothetical protein
MLFYFSKSGYGKKFWNNDLIIDPGFGFAKTIAKITKFFKNGIV